MDLVSCKIILLSNLFYWKVPSHHHNFVPDYLRMEMPLKCHCLRICLLNRQCPKCCSGSSDLFSLSFRTMTHSSSSTSHCSRPHLLNTISITTTNPACLLNMPYRRAKMNFISTSEFYVATQHAYRQMNFHKTENRFSGLLGRGCWQQQQQQQWWW